MVSRFGEFTVLEELGSSLVADRYRAMHDTLGGPFFVKSYPRLPEASFGVLAQRCEALMSIQADNLPAHLGHGEVDGVPFVVSPYLEGVDFSGFANSLVERRVSLGMDSLLFVLKSLATAVAVAVIGLPMAMASTALAAPQSGADDPFDDPFEDPLNEPAAEPNIPPSQGGVPGLGSGLDGARATARNAMRSRNWRKAIDAWTSVLAIDKNDPEAQAGLKSAQAALDQASTIDTFQASTRAPPSVVPIALEIDQFFLFHFYKD